jgi:nucleosome assembly protein 1-like 1
MKNIFVLADVLQASLVEAMRAGLENLVGTSSGYLESLPGPVKARISYLESIQADYDALDDSLNDEIKALERKYKPMFDKLLQLRKRVISGEEDVPEEHRTENEEEDEGEGEESEEVEGIPDFWLVALSNQPMFDEMVCSWVCCPSYMLQNVWN